LIPRRRSNRKSAARAAGGEPVEGRPQGPNSPGLSDRRENAAFVSGSWKAVVFFADFNVLQDVVAAMPLNRQFP